MPSEEQAFGDTFRTFPFDTPSAYGKIRSGRNVPCPRRKGGATMKTLAELFQTADWKAEKHVPVIEAPDEVKAGEPFAVTLTGARKFPTPTRPSTTSAGSPCTSRERGTNSPINSAMPTLPPTARRWPGPTRGRPTPIPRPPSGSNWASPARSTPPVTATSTASGRVAGPSPSSDTGGAAGRELLPLQISAA